MEIDNILNTQNQYGVLYNQKDLQFQRKYFDEVCKLKGIQVIYRAPRPDKMWTNYGEIQSNYFEPIVTGCLFTEHPDQRTMKKLGWVAELDEQPSIISVPFDLQGLQVGALFIIPQALNPKVGRLFRVVEMSTQMIVPASITCKLVPEYEDTYSTDLNIHTNDSFSILNDEGEINR